MSRQGAFQSPTPELQQPQGGAGDRPDLLTQVEVCAQLGISDETWRRWRKAGRVPAHVTLPSGRLKWRAEDVDRLAGVRAVAVRRQYFSSGRHASKVTVFPGTPKGHAR